MSQTQPSTATPVESQPPHPDTHLIDRVARGEDAAVADLYATYGRLAFAVALRVTRDSGLAEDAVQEAIVGAWRNADRYSASKASAKTWLLSIVHHRAVDIVRRRGSAAESPLPDERLTDTTLPERWIARDTLWVGVAGRLDAAELRGALGSLPATQRESIELAYFGGYTQLEIATATATPLGTVKSRMRSGLASLRRDIQLQGHRRLPPSSARRSGVSRSRVAA